MHRIMPGKRQKLSLTHSKALFLVDCISCSLAFVMMSRPPGQSSSRLLIINRAGETGLINEVLLKAMD